MLFNCCFAGNNGAVFNILPVRLTYTEVVDLTRIGTTAICDSVLFSLSEACINNGRAIAL